MLTKSRKAGCEQRLKSSEKSETETAFNASSKEVSTLFQRYTAFTLAEVLLVLGIIGIVAEMTIPTLISNFDDKTAVTQLKIDANLIQQAITQAEPEDGTIGQWYSGSDSYAAADAANAILSKYLKVINNCGRGPGCAYFGTYKNLSPTAPGGAIYYTNSSYSKMQLANGAFIMLTASLDNQYIDLINVVIDINGINGPNRSGYDLFRLGVYSAEYTNIHPSIKGQILFPMGTTVGALSGCDIYSSSGGRGAGAGFGCTPWAYYKGNRDYIHCNNLNWETKLDCN